ncbi:MAG: M15 family metallopeptidase [Bacillota bacterium]
MLRNTLCFLLVLSLLAAGTFLSGCEPETTVPKENGRNTVNDTYRSPAGAKTRTAVPPEQRVEPSREPEDFVDLGEYVPELEVELVYYTEHNFTGRKLYDDPRAYLRRGTAEKLKKVLAEVAQRGYRLKIWDAYRPPRVQFEMWAVAPDSRYLVNPHKGYSPHSRGCAVDVTLIDSSGRELDMPSGFDEFSPKADRDYSDVTPTRAANSRYLEEVMVRHGFISIRSEWWHFVDSEKEKYGVVEEVRIP